MLDLTYEVLSKEKGPIRNRVKNLIESQNRSEILEKWNPCKFSENGAIIGGQDGSINHKRFRNVIIYALNATALSYDGSLHRSDHAHIGILYPYSMIEERLNLYRAIFEFKTALEIINKTDLFMIDGSILSDLKSLRSFETGLSKSSKEEVINLIPELERTSGVKIESIEIGNQLDGEDKKEKIAYLEYLEYLISIENLISKGLKKLVGISKQSTRSSLGGGIPDLAVFGEITKRPGFSDAEYDFVTRKFPVYDELFRSLVFTITNIRLETGKDPFMLEIPREVGKKEIGSIMDQLRSNSVDGYPYLLKKAHKEVVIKNSDMERILNGIGLNLRTGREVLK